MTDQQPMITLADEQWDGYYEAVEELIERRKQTGTLLSTFDLIAGAAAVFFYTGNNGRIPAKWVFAAMTPDSGGLPIGLLEDVEELNRRIREASYILDKLEELEEIAQELEQTTAEYKRTIAELSKEAQKARKDLNKTLTLINDKAKVFTPPIEAR